MSHLKQSHSQNH